LIKNDFFCNNCAKLLFKYFNKYFFIFRGTLFENMFSTVSIFASQNLCTLKPISVVLSQSLSLVLYSREYFLSYAFPLYCIAISYVRVLPIVSYSSPPSPLPCNQYYIYSHYCYQRASIRLSNRPKPLKSYILLMNFTYYTYILTQIMYTHESYFFDPFTIINQV